MNEDPLQIDPELTDTGGIGLTVTVKTLEVPEQPKADVPTT